MNLGITGTWHSQFISPFSGKPHHLALELSSAGPEPTATMRLIRSCPDPVKGLIEFTFRVHVETCAGFVALLAKDTANLGMNAMILKVADDQNIMRGRLVFNSVGTNEVEAGIIEWRRQSIEIDPPVTTLP